jgi:large subunit ribosomal protein L6
MSRVGIKPVMIPEGVTVKLAGEEVEVVGAKGKLKRRLPGEVKLEVKEGEVVVRRTSEERRARGLHGLWRSLVANMIKGVSEGFGCDLELMGTGYRAKMEGKKIVISCGFSHPVVVEPPDGVKLEVNDNEKVRVTGVDRELVGQVAAGLRAIRPPEPYKGRGIRYAGEVVRRKAGKSGKAGVAGGKGVA